jgi:hypothetical protein
MKNPASRRSSVLPVTSRPTASSSALKSTYKRHGTLNLFAALEVGTGQVRTEIIEYKKRADLQNFLDGVIADMSPDKEIHVILDNYSTHKNNDDWLAKFEFAGSTNASNPFDGASAKLKEVSFEIPLLTYAIKH